MILTLTTFVLVCLATSFVCTAIKEDEDQRLARASGRLFFVMSGGILAFAAVVQIMTVIAG